MSLWQLIKSLFGPMSSKGVVRAGAIDAYEFYNEYHGHPVKHLEALHTSIREQAPSRPIIFLAGDSSLDNKHWLFPKRGPSDLQDDQYSSPAPQLYQSTLAPPRSIRDVAFWINDLLGPRATCLNTAIEATTLGHRKRRLLTQDKLIRDTITPADYLIVSVGANDIALSPSFETMRNLRQLLSASLAEIESAQGSGMQYFITLFCDRTADYINRLIAVQKPKAVVVCMIYFPNVSTVDAARGWADASLAAMGYNDDPRRLQAAIRIAFERGTSQIRLEGTKVIPAGLFKPLDGRVTGDYVARVEPSEKGGRKMAKYLCELLEGELQGGERSEL